MFPVGTKVILILGSDVAKVTGTVVGHGTMHRDTPRSAYAVYLVEMDAKFWGPLPDKFGTAQGSELSRPNISTLVCHPDTVRWDLDRNK